jgi:hypothetical protein
MANTRVTPAGIVTAPDEVIVCCRVNVEFAVLTSLMLIPDDGTGNVDRPILRYLHA